jgi:hypothetical protein
MNPFAAFLQRMADAGIRILHLDAKGRVFEHWHPLQLVPREAANDCGE